MPAITKQIKEIQYEIVVCNVSKYNTGKINRILDEVMQLAKYILKYEFLQKLI
tara:strand:- start:579 stop:737 length:159 start_codon:yes stop_codon:yes gene_type:complete